MRLFESLLEHNWFFCCLANETGALVKSHCFTYLFPLHLIQGWEVLVTMSMHYNPFPCLYILQQQPLIKHDVLAATLGFLSVKRLGAVCGSVPPGQKALHVSTRKLSPPRLPAKVQFTAITRNVSLKSRTWASKIPPSSTRDPLILIQFGRVFGCRCCNTAIVHKY